MRWALGSGVGAVAGGGPPVRISVATSEYPRRPSRPAAATASQAESAAYGRDRNGLEPFRIGPSEVHIHPPGLPPTPVSKRDFLPSAIVHLSAGGESPNPFTGWGKSIRAVTRAQVTGWRDR